MRNIIDGAAEYERGLIRARTRAALAVKKGRGERVGTLPWGYRLGADGTHLEPCDAERATTRRAIELRASGLTLAGVGEQFAAEGKLTRTGRAFDRGEVRALCLRGEPWNVAAAQLSRLGER